MLSMLYLPGNSCVNYGCGAASRIICMMPHIKWMLSGGNAAFILRIDSHPIRISAMVCFRGDCVGKNNIGQNLWPALICRPLRRFKNANVKKNSKTRIFGVDRSPWPAYNPPPLSRSGQRQSDFWSFSENRSLFEKVGCILEEIRGRRCVLTCRPLWYKSQPVEIS